MKVSKKAPHQLEKLALFYLATTLGTFDPKMKSTLIMISCWF